MRTLPAHLLAQLSTWISQHIGLHFPDDRLSELERKLAAAIAPIDGSLEPFIRSLLNTTPTQQQLALLGRTLTTGETYFFREQQSFELLEMTVLPKLIYERRGKRQQLTFWSAGCSTGEEPYSLALLLRRLLPDIANWTITIMATDINPDALQKAQRGIYHTWAFRRLSDTTKGRYFDETTNGEFEMNPQIKGMVRFAWYNLLDNPSSLLASAGSAVDVILCRNVLMYFAPEQRACVVEHFYRALTDHGWLIVSPVELSQTLFRMFVPVALHDMTFYQKVSRNPVQSLLAPSIPPDIIQLPAHSFWDRASGIIPDPSASEEWNLKPEDRNSTSEIKTEKAHQEPVNLDLAQEVWHHELVALCERGPTAEELDRLANLAAAAQPGLTISILIARMYANQGNLSAALHWCRYALDQNTLDLQARYLQAAIFQEQGHLDQATNAFKQVLYLAPTLVVAHVNLGHLTFLQGKYREAHKHFDNALTLLHSYQAEDILPESEGLTAGRMIEIARLAKTNIH